MDKSNSPPPASLSYWVTLLGVLERRSSSRSKWVLTCLWCHSLERWSHLNPSSHSDLGLHWFILNLIRCVFSPLGKFMDASLQFTPSLLHPKMCHMIVCIFLKISFFPFTVMIVKLSRTITLFLPFHFPWAGKVKLPVADECIPGGSFVDSLSPYCKSL